MPKRSFESDDSDDELRESSSEAPADSPKTKKRRFVEFEPVRICSIGSVKEIDHRILRAQHYKLCERFRYKQKIQQELEKKIEAFERRQVQDDAINCTINRYWNRLDADLQILLQRFEEENTHMDSDNEPKEYANTSNALQGKNFLNLLAQWSCEELDEKLKQRVEFSQRTTAKLMQICNHLGIRNSKLNAQLQDKQKPNSASPSQEESKSGDEIGNELRSYATSVFDENGRLQKIVTELQAENHRMDILLSSHDDKVALLESQVETLNNDIEDLRCQLRKSMRKEEKLDYRLAEYIKKDNALQVQMAAQQKVSAKGDDLVNGSDGAEELASLSKTKLEELQQELELQTELANNRLTELQEVTERNKSLSAELENCKMKLKYIPSDEIKSSSEYRCLQTCFTSLFEDCKLQKKELDDLKQQIAQLTQSYEEQINSMKIDESTELDRLQQTVLELDNNLNMSRREYENLCVQYEVNTVSKEQAGPIKDQFTSLLTSMTTHNTQLKQEVARLKRKCFELGEQLAVCQKEMDGERRLNNENYLILKLVENSDSIPSMMNSITHETAHNSISPVNSDSFHPQAVDGLVVKKEEPMDASAESQNGQQNSDRPNSANSRPGTPTDLAEAKTIIQRLCLERDRCREKLLQYARTELQEKRSQWSEEQKRKQKQLIEQCEKLRRELQNAKQEEDGLMQEMESTGQAFEELQEQNQKLLEQLREKEDVNLKLMSERIKNSQAQKKMLDEKELLEQTIQSLENQLAAKMLHCQKLEEKERILTENKTTLEHELRIREQNNETLKKKAGEQTLLASDLRLRLDRLDTQFNELRENVVKKASTHEADANKIKRLEEEKSSLKRKLDRAKKMEKLENIDQVIQEENRILRESMTCPSCKVRKKNAILDKCHHVFCFECIRQRYDNRRRKCPKCNAAFGANDFHRIYLD